MDRALPPQYIKRQRLKKGFYLLTISLILLGSIGAFRATIKPQISKNLLHTALVERGPVETSIKTSGIVFPEVERAITSPIASTIEQIHHHAGDSITEGTSILKLNQEFTQLTYEKLKDGYDLKKHERLQQRLETQKTVIDLKGAYAVLELETQALQQKIRQARHRLKAGLITEAELFEVELPWKTAQQELKRLDQRITNEAALLAANLKALDLELHIQEKRLNELERQLEMANTRSPQAGVITWVNDKIGATVQAGEVIARLANLNSFRVEASISDLQAHHLQIGGLVRIRASGTNLTGYIVAIQPTVNNGILSFIIALDEANHESLRPQLRVDVFVIQKSSEVVLRVNNGIHFQKNKDFVYRLQDNRLIRQPIQLGSSNYDFVEIRRGLNFGDQIVISDMSVYQHADELTVTQ